jgi:pectate lyase
MKRYALGLCAGLLAGLASSSLSAQPPGLANQPAGVPAFPGAEGFGANTPGGRGGAVYEVTNLNDSGPGSFRDAVSQPRRIVVFRVSGTIDLRSPLRITRPYITIAGQTAPGGGICLRNYSFEIATHDVIVRFIRSRLGDTRGQEADSISILHNCHDVILDHCSATWSVDECLSTSGVDSNITVQWCLIAEALNKSVHAKGPHGYGSLARANGPISWYHNLWAHNDARNPRLGDNYGRGSHPFFDVRYNVMYDYGQICSGLTQGIFNANYVGNYIRSGPMSKAKAPIHIGAPSEISFYLQGNVIEGNAELTADNVRMIDLYEIGGKRQVQTVKEAFPSPAVRQYSAREAYAAVLASVGACLPARDSVDARIIDTVRKRTGTIIDSQKDVGGWPMLESAPAPLDGDHDGIPDAWEKKYGLNPNNPSDANKDLNGDGYTNIEKYLNGIDPTTKIDWRDPKNNIDPLTAPLLKAAK